MEYCVKTKASLSQPFRHERDDDDRMFESRGRCRRDLCESVASLEQWTIHEVSHISQVSVEKRQTNLIRYYDILLFFIYFYWFWSFMNHDRLSWKKLKLYFIILNLKQE